MTTTTKMHGRDVAIEMYNKLCDSCGILPEHRINVELTQEEMDDLDSLPENKKNAKIEALDGIREVLIYGFRTRVLELDEECRIIQKLNKPIKHKAADGKILCSELTWECDYQIKALEANAKGIDPERNVIGMLNALMATRTGKSRGTISSLYSKDYEFAKAINSVFHRAGIPI